ncbi:LysE family transporter [Mesorhizobium sp. KR1-2]|uniref:LysE family transporter n=1 Tax=Mesorhizobium sp. KR1-2 TaxID=3156609 RepID=UPI0032B4C210
MRLDGDMLGFQAGLAFGFASMASIGPNNLMMMREGVKRGRTVIVPSLVCATYVALIVASLAFTVMAGSIDPSVHAVLLALGFAAICWFAFLSFRAFVKGREFEDGAAVRESGSSCIVRVLSVVCLNPLTYLELFFIPAALQQSFDTETERLQFVTALVLTSMLTCYGFSFGGGFVASFLRNRTGTRIFDLVSGFILASVAASVDFRQELTRD